MRDRRVRALAVVALGALLGVSAYLVVSESSGPTATNRPARAGTPSTTVAIDASRVYRTIRPSLVVIETTRPGPAPGGIGSGAVVNADADVLTALHVVQGAASIQATFADGTRSAATVTFADPAQDLAVLRVERPPSPIVPAVIGASGALRVGDTTFAVGNPLGLAQSLTAGVVSGLGRTIAREDGQGSLDDLIQFDAAVNPGSSGGPLLDRFGRIVGVVTALANPARQGFFVGIGFAVPIAAAGGAARGPDR